MTRILAIDPGPTRSAWVLLKDGCPVHHAVEANEDVLRKVRQATAEASLHVVIEKVESFGMAVGAEVFETVFWSGRFAEAARSVAVHRLGRLTVKMALCHSASARDSNVRAALIDRFGPGKAAAIGVKAKPGPLYGIAGDMWAALAVGVVFTDQAA